jgi:geranylgeranyl diphosphate synthase type II
MNPPEDTSLSRCLRCYQEICEGTLGDFFSQEEPAPHIQEAMRYSVFGRAKRLRPALSMMVGEALGEDPERVGAVASASELIHTYSLIHDDLPCMDDDVMRRGQPTCHVKFGEAVAVLAGDALLTVAFELIIQNGRSRGYSAEVLLRVIEELCGAVGPRGMISGQVKDLEAEGKDITLEELQRIHDHKTGRLFVASLRIGGILAGADEVALNGLTRYAECFGRVFQIVDDILDVVGDSDELGKPVGSDARNNKATYPHLLGIEGSWEEARRFQAKALKEIAFLGDSGHMLRDLLDYLLVRRS